MKQFGSSRRRGGVRVPPTTKAPLLCRVRAVLCLVTACFATGRNTSVRDDPACEVTSDRAGCAPRPVRISAALPPMHMGPRFLVTGAGRSGTHAVFHMLREVGVGVEHETVGSNGTVSWAHAPFLDPALRRKIISSNLMWASDNKAFKGWLYNGEKTAFTPVVHIVRHPLSVVNSILICFCDKPQNLNSPEPKLVRTEQTKTEFSFNWAKRFVALPGREQPISRAVAYWTRWNEMIDPFAISRHHIERLDIASLLLSLNISAKKSNDAMKPKDVIAAPKLDHKVGWREICIENRALGDAALRLALRYDYLDGTSSDNHTCAGFVAPGRL